MLQLSSSFAVILLLVLQGAVAVASPGRCDNWTEVDTDRFRLVSSLPEKKAVRIAERLNQFEAAVEIVTDARNVEPAAPTTVYVLGYRDWSYLPQHSELTDFSSYDRFENRIFVLADLDHGPFPFATVMHEYVHYSLANQGTLSYPRWYDEGLAEILSRSTEDRESFSIGILWRDSVRYYPWVPYETLFDTDLSNRARPDGVDVDTYNHEASLLVHYLTFGSPERKQQLTSYLAALGRGVPQDMAFRNSFHASYGDIEIESLKYSRRNLIDSFRIPKSALKPRANLVVRQIECARARADTGFAMLAEHADPVALSKDWFTGSDEDGAADWRLGRAAAALARKDFVIANQYINHAVAGRGVDGASLLRAAELLLAQVPDLETGAAALSPADRTIVDRASVMLASPNVQALSTPRAAYWRSVIALRTGGDMKLALDADVAALKRFPKNSYVAEVAARLCERTGDIQSAAGAWSIVAKYSPDLAKREAARKRLAEIDAAP
jgi:hypothetical protein